MDRRKTKIICTLGPASASEEVLREMILAGMDVARINFSHSNHAEHKEKADMIKKVRSALNMPVALLADTKGPEVRLGIIENGSVTLVEGQKFILTTDEVLGSEDKVSVSFPDLPRDVKRGTVILIDDGLIEMEVESVTNTEVSCRVINGGEISSKKGVNVPGVRLSMPYISSRDRSDIKFAVENDFDFIAASFVRNSNDVLQLRS